jgi:hypothetical protein
MKSVKLAGLQGIKTARMTGYRPWTEEDDKRLAEMKAAGKQPVLIAKELKRTEAAIVARTGILKQREGSMSKDGLKC